MGIVHHSNYIRWFENARVAWLEQYDQPYTAYVAEGFHFAVTRIEVDYLQPARFDDAVDVTTWVESVGGASLQMAYELRCRGDLIVTGRSEHAAVGDDGRVRRIPRERRDALKARLGSPA